jgi:hypothetical protein
MFSWAANQFAILFLNPCCLVGYSVCWSQGDIVLNEEHLFDSLTRFMYTTQRNVLDKTQVIDIGAFVYFRRCTKIRDDARHTYSKRLIMFAGFSGWASRARCTLPKILQWQETGVETICH